MACLLSQGPFYRVLCVFVVKGDGDSTRIHRISMASCVSHTFSQVKIKQAQSGEFKHIGIQSRPFLGRSLSLGNGDLGVTPQIFTPHQIIQTDSFLSLGLDVGDLVSHHKEHLVNLVSEIYTQPIGGLLQWTPCSGVMLGSGRSLFIYGQGKRLKAC